MGLPPPYVAFLPCHVTVGLQSGDTVDFVVGSKGFYGSDTTPLNVQVHLNGNTYSVDEDGILTVPVPGMLAACSDPDFEELPENTHQTKTPRGQALGALR